MKNNKILYGDNVAELGTILRGGKPIGRMRNISWKDIPNKIAYVGGIGTFCRMPVVTRSTRILTCESYEYDFKWAGISIALDEVPLLQCEIEIFLRIEDFTSKKEGERVPYDTISVYLDWRGGQRSGGKESFEYY